MVCREEKVLHRSATLKAFDPRDIMPRRTYLHCLIAIQELMPWVGPLPSGGRFIEPSEFYTMLLKGKAPVKPGRGAKAYRAELVVAEGDLVERTALVATPKAASTAKRIPAAASKAKHDDSDSSIYGDDIKANP